MWMARSVLLTLGLTLIPSAWAAQEVRVGAAHFPPYIVRPERGSDTGLLQQLLTAMNQLQNDYHFTLVPTSMARRVRDFDQGRVDLMLFESSNWGWKGIDYESVDLGLADSEVFVAKQQPGRDQSYFDDLKGKRLALFTGYHYAFANFNPSPAYLASNFDATLTYSHESNLQMVLRGRVDMTLMTCSFLTDLFKHNPQYKPRILVSKRLDQSYHHYAFVRPNGPIKTEEVAQLIKTLRDNGQLKAIFAPYNIEMVAGES
ncbi:transporter substrate-binding domain-containing protein [Pseudomonas sp. 7P_10.2_Bac1]|uniref:substrate-binding periplasmic protein n=1 Tax=Pseudomonas sp. 7P_10.2_Bac1 TaxID=2971614 RepID=UPI0021C6752F|nr:transporter substrate-binding domain-containing protein [Pseudomonas sp. 7P_10.2_Bac1]MCU1728698.1 transporter substrate-binding domain-containing protein [Pseudomonas sp. 7P_10.2_Bac1]